MEFVEANLQTNLNQLCRACTIEMSKDDMFHLYEEPNLSNLFIQCTSLNITRSDELPEFMCPDCNYQLIQFDDFRQKCHSSDLYFRQQKLIKLKVKFEPSSCEKSARNVDDGKLEDRVTEGSFKIDQNDKLSIIETVNDNASDDSDNYADNSAEHLDFNDVAKTSSSKLVKKRNRTGKIDLFGDAFYCDICNKKFLVKHRIEAHLKEHIGLKGYVCEICNKGYVKWSGLVFHKKRCHPEVKIEYKGKYKSKHVRSKTVKHTCNICGKFYYNKLKLEGHLRKHQGLKAFMCTICKKEYNRIDRLNKHYNAEHNTDGNFTKINCTYEGCDKTFNFKESLQSHIKFIHEPQSCPKECFVCDVCGKSAPSAFRLREHSYTHTGEKPFSCDRCPKKFAAKHKLKLHIMRHDNIRNYVCKICGLRKTTSQELKVHLNFHTKERTWPCNLCPMKSASFSSSIAHFRIVHQGLRPFKCEHCDKSFSKKDTLQHHVMTHTGEKPHVCAICDKRFIQITALKTHMKVHNKNLPAECY